MAMALSNAILLSALLVLSPHSTLAAATAELTVSGGAERERPAISPDASCEDWVAWIPPASDPAVVMQVVSKGYIDVEQNFIRLMERNSELTRHHLFLLCTDDESVEFFAGYMGIDCLPLHGLNLKRIENLWILRVQVVACLVKAGQDVLMSDSDALWLDDPTKFFTLPGTVNSNIVASRGFFPKQLALEWGATMCMGFILFRSGSRENMGLFFDVLEKLVLATGDDQRAVNHAVEELGIAWDKEVSDLRYTKSTEFGMGTIDSLVDSAERVFSVTLLPHTTFTRMCGKTISNATVVAHCLARGSAKEKTAWMQRANLWEDGGNELP